MKPAYLVVHCSDTPDTRDHSAADICRWHRERGWAQIGYHVVIRRDGTVERGREDDNPGAHVRGYNSRALGVCLIGRHEFTDIQMSMLESVLIAWRTQWPDAKVVGHTDLDRTKTCPNFDVQAWWAGVKAKQWG